MSYEMRAPIDLLLDKVEWKEVANTPPVDGGLYATHAGVFNLEGFSLRVYQLNDGQRVIDAEDMATFFQGFFS